MSHQDFLDHLKERGLRPWHKVYIDLDNELVTFPLYCGDKWIGYQKYSHKETSKRNNGGRYFTWVSEAYKQCFVYGTQNCYGFGPLFVCEGVWDAIRLSNCWVDAIAVLCNDPHKQCRWWVRQYANGRPIVVICDRDEAGGRLASVGDYSITVPSPFKDANEMSDDECQEFLLSQKHVWSKNEKDRS